MIETQKAEAKLADIQAELEAETAKLMKETQQKLELSKIDGEILKVKAIETVYMEEEAAASAASLPARSSHSQVSRVSMHSSIAQKAKIAGLEAEREAKIKTQEAEIKIQRIKENHDIELKRRLRVAKQKIEVLKMDEQLAEARAIGQYISTMPMNK